MFISLYFPRDEPCAKTNRIFYLRSPAFRMHKRHSPFGHFIFSRRVRIYLFITLKGLHEMFLSDAETSQKATSVGVHTTDLL